MSYPSHLEGRLKAIRLCMARNGRLPSLHEVWRQVIVDQLTIRREEVTEASIAALAATLDREAIVAFGVLYPSVTAAARNLGIDPSNIYVCMTKRGMSFEEAVAHCIRVKGGRKKAVSFEGVDYPSIRAAAKALGVDYEAVKRLVIRQGMTFEEAVTHSLGRRVRTKAARTSVSFENVNYPSIKAAADALDVEYTSIHGCLRRGMTFEESIRHLLAMKMKNISFDGVEFPSVNAAALALGLNPYLIGKLMDTGMTFEDAVRNRLTRKRSSVSFDGVEYPGVTAAARALGVDLDTVRNHMNKGKTFEAAIRHVQRIKAEGQWQKVSFNGVKYQSLAAATQAAGVAETSIRRYIVRGMTFEDAVRLILASKAKVYSFDGTEYPSLLAASNALGVERKSIGYSMKNGRSFEEAVRHLLARKAERQMAG